MDMTKEKIQKIRREYKANEDNNYHSENIVLLAKHFGTKEDFEKAKSLAKQAERAGHTPDDVNQEMNKIHKKLYPVLVSFERIFKMAKGGSVKKRYNRFGFKPYGETKGKFKLEYVENGEKQSEIIESEEMAVDTARRYSKLGYGNIRVLDKDGNKIEFAKGGVIVTSISDIPNLEEKIKSGKVTYRGIGLGKMSKEFYEKTGEEGYRIKVDNKEYFITDSEFEKIARDKSGKMRIPFDAPRRKFDDGGELPSGQIKWQEADYGDSAYVKAEDKLGFIIKPYGRRFHLRFVDGTEKTYDAKELEFYKNGESYAEGGEISEEDRFNYMMLDRLRTDVEYYLGYGRRRKDILRGASVDEHINAMKEIWHKLPEKPQWLSMEQIDDYRNRMIHEEEWEMVVISKESEKDGGEFIKNKYLVTAQNVDEAKNIAEESWRIENVFSDLSFVKVMTEAMYESKYKDQYAKGGEISRKGTYTGRIIKTDDAGEVMIGKISGYHSSGEPVYDVHKFGELRKDMREKVGELSNTKIKNILKKNTYAKGGMVSGRYYRDRDGNEFRYIGEGKDGKGLFQSGQNYVQKEYDEFGAAKETKLFGWFGDGGKVKRKRYATGDDFQIGDIVELETGQKAKVIRVEETWLGVQASNNTLKDVYKKDVKKLEAPDYRFYSHLMAKGGVTKSTRLPEIAMELFKKPYAELTPQQQKACRDERDKRMGLTYAKGGEIKVGDILEASTGVKVKVIEYDTMFGGRVKVRRIDEYDTGKPSKWMPVSKFKRDVGSIRSPKEYNELVKEKENLVKDLSPKEIADMWNKNTNKLSHITVESAEKPHMKMYLRNLLVEKELTEEEYEKYFAKGGTIKKKRTRFVDKVDAIADRLEGTKVPKRLKKDYGG